ncbi:MAG TPA: acyl-CoA dehydrogenase family protein [Acidimicrobiales bacterium]|nr:acyl-CoA dehydrogenase family protein [Acidimicrobiales bacterium]
MSDDVVIEPADLHEYRLRARAWLQENMTLLRRRDDGTYEDPDGSDPRPERVAHARELQRTLFEGGFAGITYPAEYGGQGLSLDHERVFLEESAGYDMPTQVFAVSLNILGPTLLAFGNHQQKAEHVPRMLAGEELWLQFLSEPSGGSDLAGLLTRATRDGDTYILNGQKIWSTGAQHSDFAMCPARTRWDVPKHKGISVFIIDLSWPGIEIRPIRQINGGAEFCEEFLTDVVVPAANLVGEENEGWRVARGLLQIEHEWVGRSGGGQRTHAGVDDLVALARRRGLEDDPGVRRKIAAMYAAQMVHAQASVRVSNAIAAGRMDHGYGGALKLSSANLAQRRSELGLELAGSDGVAWHEGDTSASSWSHQYLSSRSSSIAGGTNEVQRNNVGERALGLPREPTFDRDVPFNELLRG